MIETEGEVTPRAFAHISARDSLSPQRSPLVLKEDECAWARQLIELSQHDDDAAKDSQYVISNAPILEQATEGAAEITKPVQHDNTSFPNSTVTIEQPHANKTMPTAVTMAQASSPRFPPDRRHRPFALELDDSWGATRISPAELRTYINSAEIKSQTAGPCEQTIDHIPFASPLIAKGRKKYPLNIRQPACPPPLGPLPSIPKRVLPAPMGNQHSHPAHRPSQSRPSQLAHSSLSEDADDASSGADITDPRSVAPSRKPSGNLVKNKISKSKPRGFTATVIEVPRAATAPNLDLIEDDWQDEDFNQKQNIKDKNAARAHHVKTMSAPSPVLLAQPDSPATITEENAARPMSAGTTITKRSTKSDDKDFSSSPYVPRISALSPTIPTPSPIPQDSPHQYGLRDSADTPSLPELDASKLKRRSNGLDIFNEAKSLQSAASFLNGLSNARRRNESRSRMRSTTQSTTQTSLVTASTSNLNQSSIYNNSTVDNLRSLNSLDGHVSPAETPRPITPKLDDISRTLGHTNKTSGFAYAKPLSLVQLKCYRNHERLMRSGNKYYQVECAVCHQDDDGTYYWSCSWCALRMCDGCRTSLRQHGVNGLWEKIRTAELGAQMD